MSERELKKAQGGKMMQMNMQFLANAYTSALPTPLAPPLAMATTVKASKSTTSK